MKLILLPGMDGTGILYESFRAALSPDVELCPVRYPPDKILGYDELEKLAAAALPHDEPFILLGESFSGSIAIRLAAQKPSGLRGLILCCTFAKDPIRLAGLFRHLPRLALIESIVLFLLGKIVLGKFSTPALVSLLREAASQVSPAVLRHRARAALFIDTSAALHAINVPALYLQATHDRLIPRCAVRHIQKHLPAIEIMPIHAPHCLLQANPTAAATAIFQWLSAEHLM